MIENLWLQCAMILLSLVVLTPLALIIKFWLQEVYIDNDGILVNSVLRAKKIAWTDIEFIKFESVLTSFTKSRFDKPKDIVVTGKAGQITIISYIDGYFEILSELKKRGLIDR